MDNDINKEQQNDEKRLLVQTDFANVRFFKISSFLFLDLRSTKKTITQRFTLNSTIMLQTYA
jgi:hypothetical protein